MKKFILMLCIGLLTVIGCTKNDEDFGQYFEFTYLDTTVGIIHTDSVHVVLSQLGRFKILSPVPFVLKGDSLLRDTIKFTFNVLYGGYGPTPHPVKQLIARNDTIFLWYANSVPINFPKAARINSISSIETSPRITYYSIQSVEITKSPNKFVTFESFSSEI